MLSEAAQSTSELRDGEQAYESQQSELKRLPVDSIDILEGWNPRRSRNSEKHASQRESMRAMGQIQPISVRPNPKNAARFFLIAGEGRLLNARELKWIEIDCKVHHIDERTALAMAIAENAEREDVSIADEARATARALDLCDGSAELAARQLGWPIHKVRARMLLLHACEQVLNALNDNQIALGHAELLSQLPATTQAGTLVKVVAEKWTIEQLKEKIRGFAMPLGKACFDKTDCNTCHHNSQLQSSLFANNIGDGKCSNRECFKRKTSEALEIKVTELRDEYPVIFLSSIKPASSRTTIEVLGKNGVGDEQAIACKGCGSFGAILTDEPGREGQIITGQCFNLSCHNDKVKEYRDSVATTNGDEDNVETSTQTSKAKSKETTGTTSTKAKEKSTTASSAAVPSAVRENELAMLCAAAKDMVDAHDFVQLALTHAMLQRYHSQGSHHTLEKQLRSSLAKTAEVLRAEIKTILVNYMTGDHSTSIALLAHKAHADESKSRICQKWILTDTHLKNYTISGIESLMHEAGFVAAYDAKHGENAFSKIAKSGKDKFIASIVKFEFDWTPFAPKSLYSHLTKK